MNDGDLDDLLKSVLRDFPNAGYTRMSGLLLARGTRPRQSRIRSAVQGVNLEGCLLRAQELTYCIAKVTRYTDRQHFGTWMGITNLQGKQNVKVAYFPMKRTLSFL